MDVSRLPFTVEDVADVGLGDEVVVALEPVVAVLADVRRVVAGLQRADVVDHSKQRVPAPMSDNNFV